MTGILPFKITNILLYLLSISLAIGSINPFNPVVGEQNEAVNNGFTPLLLVLFLFFAMLDTKIYQGYKKIAKYVLLLIAFLIVVVLSSILYDINTWHSHIEFFLKLFIAELSFVVLFLYFYHYKQCLVISMKLYMATCIVIITLYFLGALDNYSYISNGRLVIFGENSNSFSARISLAFIFVLYFIKQNESKTFIIKWGLIVSCVLLYAYIFLSGSRGSFIAVSLCVCFVFVEYVKKHIFALLFLLVVLGMGHYFISNTVAYVDSNYSMFERLEELKEGNERSKLMKYAVDIYLDNPVWGCGVNGYEQEKRLRGYSTKDSHCIATSILAISGFVGISLFSIYIFCLLRENRKKTANVMPFLITIFMLFISLKTGGVLTYMLMWYTYGVSLALSYSNPKK